MFLQVGHVLVCATALSSQDVPPERRVDGLYTRQVVAMAQMIGSGEAVKPLGGGAHLFLATGYQLEHLALELGVLTTLHSARGAPGPDLGTMQLTLGLEGMVALATHHQVALGLALGYGALGNLLEPPSYGSSIVGSVAWRYWSRLRHFTAGARAWLFVTLSGYRAVSLGPELSYVF